MSTLDLPFTPQHGLGSSHPAELDAGVAVGGSLVFEAQPPGINIEGGFLLTTTEQTLCSRAQSDLYLQPQHTAWREIDAV